MRLEGKNSSSICFVTFFVYSLTMASSAANESMNSEVTGSILTVSRKKKKGLFYVREPVELNPLKKMNK